MVKDERSVIVLCEWMLKIINFKKSVIVPPNLKTLNKPRSPRSEAYCRCLPPSRPPPFSLPTAFKGKVPRQNFNFFLYFSLSSCLQCRGWGRGRARRPGGRGVQPPSPQPGAEAANRGRHFEFTAWCDAILNSEAWRDAILNSEAWRDAILNPPHGARARRHLEFRTLAILCQNISARSLTTSLCIYLQLLLELSSKTNTVLSGFLGLLNRKKSFSIFPSPAGMSLTKLSLGPNNDVIYKLLPPRESLVIDIPAGDGNMEKLFLRCILNMNNNE